MNPHLADLLADVGVEGTHDPGFWRRILMVRANGPVPDVPGAPEDMTRHGFHLVILDRRGRSVDRVKCRSPLDQGFERECRLMESLGNDPELEGIVPPTRTACSDRLRIHRTPHVPGAQFKRLRSRRDTARWVRDMSGLLSSVRRVTERAAERFPELLEDEGPVVLLNEVTPALETLESRGLARQALDSLTLELEGVLLPRRLQFGDLWPGNTLRSRDGWILIDFERLGAVRFPLFDVFHLVWATGLHRRQAGLGPVIDPGRDLAYISPREQADTLLLDEAETEGVPREQIRSAFLAFAIELSAYRARPGMSEPAWRPCFQDLERIAEGLAGSRRTHRSVEEGLLRR